MKKILLNILIFILLFAGSLMISWYFLEGPVMLSLTQVEANPEIFAENYERATEEATFDFDDIYMLDWTGLANYVNAEVHAVGQIIIPSANINLPIFIGSSNANISLGAGTMVAGTQMGQGNFVLGSHHITSIPEGLFGPLYWQGVDEGDIVLLMDSTYLYIYETTIASHVIGDYRIDILDEVEDRVYATLFTCTPDGTERVMTRSEFVMTVPVGVTLEELEAIDLAPHLHEQLMDFVENYTFDEENEAITIATIAQAEVYEFPTLQVAGALGLSLLVSIGLPLVMGRSGKEKKG